MHRSLILQASHNFGWAGLGLGVGTTNSHDMQREPFPHVAGGLRVSSGIGNPAFLDLANADADTAELLVCSCVLCLC